MSTLDLIKLPVKEDLKAFDDYFSNYLKSNASLLNLITSYVLKTKGKQIRPLLVFLSAKLFDNVNSSTFQAASLIELMHTATLIHDDVVDDSYERRGMFSVNALWKNKVAVLIGDYFLAKGLLLAVEKNEFKLLQIVSEAVKEMSEGELLQIEKARKLDINEDLYYKIIRKKTATLLAACTYSGSVSAGISEELSLKMKEMGYHIGMAFQIKDDLFDFNLNNKTGKPAGNDIREQKYTLPLIYTLKNCSIKEKKELLSLLKNFEKNKKSIQEINTIINEHHGFEYTQKVMMNYIQNAKEILSTMPQNEANKSLQLLIDYIVERNK
ncbi:MAG: polyprenyl synthetase family protein [Bacteroidales bacterium]|nr:polyprenyl synthetase family protein [Bacteroidales bacterium]